MKLQKLILFFFASSLLFVAACGQKDPLKGINKIAIIGVTYSKGIETNHQPTVTLFNPTKHLGTLLADKPVGNPPPPSESPEPKKDKSSDLGIDTGLRDYFDSIIVDLTRMIVDKGVEVVTPSAFATNPTFASLAKQKNDSTLAKLIIPTYSPAPYASAIHNHDKQKLAQLAQELGVDAVLTIRLAVVEETKLKMMGIPQRKLGLETQIGIVDKNGNTVLSKNWSRRVMGDSEVDASALMFGDNSMLVLTVDNSFTFEQLRKKFLAKMSILLTKKNY